MKNEALFTIVDRKEEAEKATSLAKEGGAIVLTKKSGGEVKMCVEKGKKNPWNERKIVDDILNKKAH